MTRTTAPNAAKDAYDAAVLQELGRLALKVANNPETRRPFLQAVRKVDPDRRFPDQDMQDFREEMDARLAKEREDREIAETNARLAAQRQGLIASGRYTEEQVKEIETTIMPKYGLADYDAAATIYGSTMAPAKPRNGSTNDGVWTLPTFEGLLENPTTAARGMAHKVIDEIVASRPRR